MPGPVESLENQTQVFHPFHRPLEISRRAQDFHIPTAQLAPRGKVENQKPVSHFSTPRKRRRQPFLSPQTLTPNERKSAATRPPHPPCFQDHLVLKSNPVSGSFLDWNMLRNE